MRRQEGRLHGQGEQLRRGDALRDGRRDRQEERRRRHRGRASTRRRRGRPRATASTTRGSRRTDRVPHRGPPRLRRGALPQARRRDPKKDRVVHEKTGDPKTFLERELSQGRALARRSRSSTAGRAPTSTSWTCGRRSPTWRPLVAGAGRALRRGRRRRPLLRLDQRGRAQVPRLPRRPAAPGARPAGRRSSRSAQDATLEGVGVVGHRARRSGT